MREADRNHGPSESPLYLIKEANRIVGSEMLIIFERELISENKVRKEMRKRE